MILNILELRNRMLNCKPGSKIRLDFLEDDQVELHWYVGDNHYAVDSKIHAVNNQNSRVFERKMHTAKRVMRTWD